MATRLYEVLTFADVPAGQQATQAHHLNVNEIPVIPDFIYPYGAGFALVSSTTSAITVRNDGDAAATLQIALHYIYSPERLFGQGISHLTPNPFWVSGDGAGGGGGGGLVVDANAFGGNGTAESPLVLVRPVNVKDFGAVGDYDPGTGTGTDDRDAINAAFAAAVENGLDVYFPPGNYWISKYLYLFSAYRTRVWGLNATLYYPSADTSLVADGIAPTNNAARSGIYMSHCQYVQITLSFRGQESIYSDAANKGSGIYQRNCRFTKLVNCTSDYGYSLHQQDQQGNTNGRGDSLTVNGDIITLNDSDAKFVPGHVNCEIALAGCANQGNQRALTVASYISPTQITFVNPFGAAEVDQFTWTIQDGDFATVIEFMDQNRARGVNTLPEGSDVCGGTLRWPTEYTDLCGIGDRLVFDAIGNTVTLTDKVGRFLPVHDGKWIQIANATSPGNNTIAQLKYISATQVSFSNPAGVTENFLGNWWIISGEKIGHGAGAGSITVVGTTVTFVSADAIFDAGDNGKSLILRQAVNTGNRDHHFAITVVSPTTVTFESDSAVNEDYAGLWTIDGWDSTGGAGSATGSLHGFYVFSANNGWESRSHVSFRGVKFFGNRTCCMKFSGSATPLRNIVIENCQAFSCDGFVVFGADDSNDHSALKIANNVLVDCGPIHRRGQMSTETISILGARSIAITGNIFHYTRESIQHQFGSTGGLYIIHLDRYVTGTSQPIEDCLIAGNKLTVDWECIASAGNIAEVGIRVQDVGRREKYGAGTLTKNGTTMTLTSPGSSFYAPTDTDRTLKAVNFPTGANNGNFQITDVPSKTTLTYENAAGVAEAGGTYRFQPPNGYNTGMCKIINNQINVGGYGVYCTACIAPEIVGNQFMDMIWDVFLDQNAMPIVTGNRTLLASPNTGGGGGTHARIFMTITNTWPCIWGNYTSTPAAGASHMRAWDLSTDGANRIDFPLLGRVGRAKASEGREEIVFAFGSGLCDGDTITVNGTTLTFKATAPGAGQFNDQASLIAAISGLAGLTAADYGADFDGGIATGHVRVRNAAVSTADGSITITTATVSSAALALLYNDPVGQNTSAKSRGSASAGPIPDKAVIWSPMSSLEGFATIVPGNEDARTVLKANGPAMPLKNPSDSGACEVQEIGDTSGAAVVPEFRFALVA